MQKGIILVVDDDADIREALTFVLMAEGYTVEAVASGKAALDYLHTRARPDVILVDLMMPGIDGYEFCHLCQQEMAFANIPVIMLTAAGRMDEKIKALGLAGCFPKPIATEVLLDVIEQCLQQAKLKYATIAV